MPKKNATAASYYGHQGIMTDARDNLHEVNPSRTIDGENVDGLTVEPVEEFDETPAPGTEGPVTALTDENGVTNAVGQQFDPADEDKRDDDGQPVDEPADQPADRPDNGNPYGPDKDANDRDGQGSPADGKSDGTVHDGDPVTLNKTPAKKAVPAKK